MDWDKERVVSLITGIGCVLVAFFADGYDDLIYAFFFASFCIALIWFGDDFGEMTGLMKLRPLTPTPGIFIKAVGWVILVGAFTISFLSFIFKK